MISLHKHCIVNSEVIEWIMFSPIRTLDVYSITKLLSNIPNMSDE